MKITNPIKRFTPFPVLGDVFPKSTPIIERIRIEIGWEKRHCISAFANKPPSINKSIDVFSSISEKFDNDCSTSPDTISKSYLSKFKIFTFSLPGKPSYLAPF